MGLSWSHILIVLVLFVLLFGRGLEPGERGPQPRQEAPLVLEQLVLVRREDF